MQKRTITAAVLLSLLLMTGCAGQTSQSSSESVPPALPDDSADWVTMPYIPEENEPEAEPATEPETEPERDYHRAERMLEKMTLHEKICQMFIVTPEQLTGYGSQTMYDDWTGTCIEAFPVGGFIMFSQNIWSAEQITAFNSALAEKAMQSGIGAFISVDEEGGSLTRLQPVIGGEAVNDMAYYGELNDYDAAYEAGAILGRELSGCGFNLDFAPVADVNLSPDNELGRRIFSSDPDIVAAMSAAVSDGLHSEGICSTLKHFPGLGAGSANTHYGSVWIDRTYDQLQNTEFTAFSGGIAAGADFVMVGHQITSGAEDDLPGDLSWRVTTEWLRKNLGFEGIAISDSHQMGAITNNYTADVAAVMAVQAGIDIILMPADTAGAVYGIEAAVDNGDISEERIDESVLRILEKKDELGLLDN
ncbi:MAG: glycoside hydrolase family 3 [Ruminococcus sp.]|nr:glycoside hydrolase family 3 [Ruminococcus sp.]